MIQEINIHTPTTIKHHNHLPCTRTKNLLIGTYFDLIYVQNSSTTKNMPTDSNIYTFPWNYSRTHICTDFILSTICHMYELQQRKADIVQNTSQSGLCMFLPLFIMYMISSLLIVPSSKPTSRQKI